MKILVLWVLFISVSSYTEDKLCTDNYIRDACTNIQRSSTYECLEVYSKLGCFTNIDQGQHQFAVVDPEQALLAATFVSDNVVVIGEVLAEKAPYQTVVIVRKFYNNTFEDLRGKRLCHPGFKHDELVTKYVLGEFENRIIDGNFTFCNDSTTLLEKELSVLSNFFEKSCRPGPWTNEEDDELDTKLKEKYSNLCELCGPQKCKTVYQAPFNDTLTCLVQSGGDVAITSLSDALIFFNTSNNFDNFQYICRNGSASSPSNPCTWTNQLNKLIITEKDVVTETKAFLKTNMPYYLGQANQSASGMKLQESLELVLQVNKNDRMSFIDPVSLPLYVTARRPIPTLINNSHCHEEVKWCTLNSAEQQKCIWLQQAALNTGLKPVIQCVQSQDNDTISCLNDIQSGTSDIVYTDITFGYIAAKKKLFGIAYPEIYPEELASVVIVVRNDTTDINSLKDLKGKSACIPLYGGREWLTFIDTLKTASIVDTSCDYSQLFSDFVGTSCVPGANSKDYEFSTGNSEKLCEQCLPVRNTLPAKYCNADSDNKHFGTDGALRCLSAGYGEYAVITIKDITEFKENSESFKILSKKGSLTSTNNWHVDEDSALNILTSGEVVIKNDTSKKDDIVQLLKGIDVHFGQSLRKLFKVFERFNGTQDLLFPESTIGLTFGEGSGTFVENFETLLKRSEQCELKPNSAVTFVSSSILMTAAIFLVFRY